MKLARNHALYMAKILYIITKSDVGGAQKYVRDLSANLDKDNFEAKILYGGHDIKWLSNKTHPWFLFLNDWLAVFEIAKILKTEQPDIMHLNSSKAGVIGALGAALAGGKTKVIFTAHGWVFNPTNELGWFVRNFYIFLHKFAAIFQDKIICVSEYDYCLALRHNICKKEKLSTIHNGIDPSINFLGKKAAREEIIKKTGGKITANSKKAWVGSVGRLVKEKNYETLAKAAKLLPEAAFFIIGSGPEENRLRAEINGLKLAGRFFIVPPTGNDAVYLKAFDVFAMSSVKEGLPYILLEAMAAELPIVITEAGGMPELIKNHENGLMVAQKNPGAMAKAIGGILENPGIAGELAQKAKIAVSEKFSLKQMINKTEKVYLG